MKITKNVAAISAAVGATFGAAAYAAGSPFSALELSAVAQCTTSATGHDGRRHSCDSEAQTIKAPEGFVLAQNSLAGGLTSGSGSEHNCNIAWGDFVEVIPHVTQPRTFTVRAHARSPRGHFSGRGWATCKYTVLLAPLQQSR